MPGDRELAIRSVHRLRYAFSVGVVVLLVTSTTAAASDSTVRLAVNTWSKRISVDARAVTADAKLPRRLTADAIRFQRDALRARAVIASKAPSTSTGRRARRLALTAFADFARAGSEWAASGRGRAHQQLASSITNARAGAHDARTGNLLLVNAGTLLRK
jgi:hypothetical protein